jgi:hypothetical protein
MRMREEGERPELDGALLRALGVGAGLAALFYVVGPLHWVFSTFATLFHEMGHAVFAWIFGRPAIPKFDLQYGGGFTSWEERKGVVLLLAAAVWAGFAWSRRRNPLALGLVLGGAGLWALLAFTRGCDVVVLCAGHGGELLLAGLFLWRALTGSSVVHEAERPLYAAIGLFVLLEAALFALGLLHGGEAREAYEAGKGGILPNDFVQVADILGTGLEAVVLPYLLACVATLAAAFLAWWRADLLRAAWARLAD